jgi:Na+/alanine symporter
MILGFRRAVFSNEAGPGSASIAHSAAKTDEPLTEGCVSLLEPFPGTVVIFTLAALVIVALPNIMGLYLLAPIVKRKRHLASQGSPVAKSSQIGKT